MPEENAVTVPLSKHKLPSFPGKECLDGLTAPSIKPQTCSWRILLEDEKKKNSNHSDLQNVGVKIARNDQ